jgi:hypothetical protein
MKNLVVAMALILAAVAPGSPANALTGPLPGSKLQNLARTDVEQVRGFVARGPHGGRRLLLVLHRSQPDPGVLGRLPLAMRAWSEMAIDMRGIFPALLAI